MKKASIVLFMMILALSFCSKGKESPTPQVPVHEKNEPRAPQEAAGEVPLQIKAVTLNPEAPTILDDVTAVAELNDPDLENVNFQYQWFVNGREMPEISGDKLEKAHFKKGAWLYCRVKSSSGGIESEWFKSDIIRVHNSLPAFKLEPVGKFSVPGEFQYQAAASDPDGDILTYELLSPLDQGILLDSKTGLLTWNLDNKIIEKLGETIVISLSVGDNDAKPTTGSLTLRFQKKQQ